MATMPAVKYILEILLEHFYFCATSEWYEPHRKSSGWRQSMKTVHVNQTRSSEATLLELIEPIGNV
jgi:hypothetical protein